MIDNQILKQAIEINLEEINKDIKRRGGEIIYVPIRVETYEGDGRIGCLDHSGIMGIYNDIIRGNKK